MSQTPSSSSTIAQQRSNPTARRQVGPAVRVRATQASIAEEIETNLLTLTPAFIEALKKIAPKKRSSKVPYVIAAALLAVIVALGADPSAREFGVAKGRPVAARLHLVSAAPAADVSAAPVLTSGSVEVVTAAATVSPTAASPMLNVGPVLELAPPAAAAPVVTRAKKTTKSPAAQSKKPQPRSSVRQPMQGRTATVTGPASIRGV